VNPWGVTVPPATESEFFNAARPTVFLLVEGGSDQRFWTARVDIRRCQVRTTDGRAQALRELDTIRSEGRKGFIAVLDADFDRIEGTLLEDPDVVWTDLHDLESILVASPALEKVLAEVGSPRKIEEFEQQERRPIRDVLLSHALWLGRLRWLSRREKLDLQFRKLPPDSREFRYLNYHSFCEKASWRLDHVKLVRTVLNFCSRHDLSVDSLLARMKALPEADAWQLCVGHDLIGLLAVGLRAKLGSRNALSIEGLQERLRLAFERAHLEMTAMYQALRSWERRNEPFRVFAGGGEPRP
jgi:hypothetical protein